MTTTPRPTLLGRLAALVAAALALALGLVAVAGPADAHDGDAVIAVEAAHPAGTGVHYIVRVTWQDDGHPAADATVTATAVGADGTQLTPVTLAAADGDGRYAGVVEFPSPGSWTVRITSIEPTGTVEQPQEVTAPPTTEPVEGGSEVTTGQAADDEAGGFAPADDGTGESTAQGTEGADSDDGMPVFLIAAAAIVVVIGAVTAVNIIRRNRPDLTGDGGADPVTGTPAPDTPAPRGSTPDGTDIGPVGSRPAPSSATAGGASDDPTPDP
jgi:hypothetical protein